MSIQPIAKLKCNSQSAGRTVAGTTSQWIGPFILERSERDGSTIGRKLDRQARRRICRHFSLRALQQVESRRARLRFTIETEASAGESGIEYRHPMERQRHP